MTTHPPYTVFFANDVDKIPVWTIELNDIELVAGMLAGGAGIMDDLNYETKGATYYIDSNADVSHFRLVNSIPEERIPENTCGKIACNNGTCNVLGCPEPGQYGLWMNSGKRFYYSLYAFRKPSFIQGVISICNTFKVDFRNYIFGLPFDGNGNQYALGDYIMTPYQIAQDAPDLYDIEEEEEDNENIIQPLHRED
jgi:hypothetical protein